MPSRSSGSAFPALAGTHEHPGQGALESTGFRTLFAKGLARNRHGFAVQHFGLCESPLSGEAVGDDAQGVGHGGMLGPEDLAADRERFRGVLLRLGVLPEILQHARHVDVLNRNIRMIVSESLLSQFEGFSENRLGRGRIALARRAMPRLFAVDATSGSVGPRISRRRASASRRSGSPVA